MAEEEFSFAFSHNPARLNRSEFDLYLIQRAQIIEDERAPGEWKVSTLSYEYNIERRVDCQEVIAFHWEGHGAANPTPHIHIGFAGDDKSTPFSPKNHIPSGRVFVEDIVRFLIDEMAVKPTNHRSVDWREIIAKTKQAVMRYKTW